jgi:hypothetical protein
MGLPFVKETKRFSKGYEEQGELGIPFRNTFPERPQVTDWNQLRDVSGQVGPGGKSELRLAFDV